MSTKRKDVKNSLAPVILEKIKQIKPKYEKEGFVILGLLGSYARNSEDIFSDIDLAYKIDHDRFFKDNAFKKLLRIEEIKKELETTLHKKVDLISVNSKNKSLNNSIKKEMIAI